MSDGPACAHLNVRWAERQVGSGRVTGWWECSMCLTKFVPLGAAEFERAAREQAARLEEARWWLLQIQSRIHGINFYQHKDFEVPNQLEKDRIAELEARVAALRAGEPKAQP